jgi:hypothetical protein
MGKNRSASGLTNIIQYDDSGNIAFVSGSTTLMSVSSSGAITTTGVISGSNVQSASLALDSNLLQGTGSVGFTTTASFTATSGSASSRLTQIESVYATTGSNSFRATQSITGSLTVTGQIIAQTINVQQVTSSIIYSSGSNVFGCDINSRQTFTGSFYQSGSVAYFGGYLGLNKVSPQRQYTQVANSNGIVFAIQNSGSSNEGYVAGFDTLGNTYIQLNDTLNAAKICLNTTGSSYIIGGNLGVGSTNPLSKLDVCSTSGSLGIINPFSITGYNATTNTGGQATSYGGLNISNAIDSTLIIRLLGSGHTQIATDAAGRYISFATGLFTERVRITSGGRLQLNGASGEASITTDSTANVIGMYTNPSVVDGIPRIEVTGCSYPSTPSTAFIRADTVRFTLNSASTETMRISSGGCVGIRSNSPRATLHVQQATNDGTPSLGTARDGTVFTSNNGNYGLNITIDPSGDTLMQAMRFDGSATAYALKLQPAGGAVVTPNQPLAMGAMSGDQYIAATSFTTISFSTSYGFNQANVGGSWNNSNHTFTAPQTGVYLINASLYTSNVGQIAAFINGSRTISMVSGVAITGGATWHGTMMIKLGAGDALTLRGYGDSGGYVYQNTYHTWFGIYFLG